MLITNNRYRESPLHRVRIDEGLLEINIVRGGHAAALLKAGFDLVAGRWRREDLTKQVAVREVTITTRRKYLHASVDGERGRAHLAADCEDPPEGTDRAAATRLAAERGCLRP